jgi:hypothetical protein
MPTPRKPFEPSADPATEAAVRRAVAHADSPTIITVYRTQGSIAADAIRLHREAVDHRAVAVALHAIAVGMTRFPGYYDDVYGYAIALPEYDLAYLRTVDGPPQSRSAPGRARDDPRRRGELTEALGALLDAGPGHRGANRPRHPFPELGLIDHVNAGPPPFPPPSVARRHRQR